MQEIVRFKAHNGKLFDNAHDCLNYEIKLQNITNIANWLNPIPDGDDFVNGNGYVQQDPETVKSAMIKILEISNLKLSEQTKKLFLTDPFKYRNNAIGRILDDFENKYLYQIWSRFRCMDDMYREWGQPYYVLYPDKAKSIKERKIL